MDSVSHIRVANLLMDYVEQTCGVTFDPVSYTHLYNDTIVRLCKYHKRLSEPFIFRLHILFYTPKVWKGYYDF